MKTVGLVTEYNPFHNGHLYHLQKALEVTGAEISIAVMSGDFVQRGAPAIINKYERAKCAVNNGVNLVVELPAFYSLSSAENFAHGGVSTLAALGVSSICFGCENDNKKMMYDIASILVNESDEFKMHLQKGVNSGLSYPAARADAISETLISPDYSSDDIKNFLSSPNNILGIEYTKAILAGNLNMETFPILRKGTGYNETSSHKIISGELPSASAIRDALKAGKLNSIKSSMPPDVFNALLSASKKNTLMDIDKLTEILNYRIISLMNKNVYNKENFCNELCRYYDITPSLANRIFESYDGSLTVSEFIEKLKTKQYTYSRISRSLLHILLDLRSYLPIKYLSSQVPYIRILGFDDKGKKYLSEIKKKCAVPLITKPAKYKKELMEDYHICDIYEMVKVHSSSQTKKRLIPELRKGVYIKKENK